jgi:predicted amidophosphoribosyltransferase
MPLINCPDCQKECSNMALSCPYCGRPILRSSVFVRDLGIDGIVFRALQVVGIILGLYGSLFGWLLALIGTALLLLRARI